MTVGTRMSQAEEPRFVRLLPKPGEAEVLGAKTASGVTW